MNENESIEIPFGAKDSELKGWEYTIPEGMEAEIKDGKIIVREKESEDEKIRKDCIKYLDCEYQHCSINEDKIKIEKCIAWLEKQGSQNLANSVKTCKDEQNLAWSEEDEKELNDILTCDERHCYLDAGNIIWLKSLKERYTWKPSDEQMEALKHIADGWATSDSERMNINALYNDLKKLKE